MTGRFARILRALISAEEKDLHPVFSIFRKIKVREAFSNSFFTKFAQGEIEHNLNEGRYRS